MPPWNPQIFLYLCVLCKHRTFYTRPSGSNDAFLLLNARLEFDKCLPLSPILEPYDWQTVLIPTPSLCLFFYHSSSGRAVFLVIFPQHQGVSHLFWSRLLSLGKVQGSGEKRGLETQNHFQVVEVCNKWRNMFAATVPFPSGKCLSHSNPAQQNKTPNAFSSPVCGKYTAWF